ncbi:MAG TPA: hypothetical protein VIY47_12375 [Ignavibacteriaceae bacterium]
MTEDDTYSRLKGLTEEEADKMYDYLYRMGMDSETTMTIQDVIDFVNERLRPYGWSVERLKGNE